MENKDQRDQLRADLLAAWNANRTKDVAPTAEEIDSWLRHLKVCLTPVPQLLCPEAATFHRR